MEDKQKILDAFCKVLQMTRDCSDLVNITGDSGTAMLKDVLKAVD